VSDTINARLAAIRSKPFGDLTSSEQAEWFECDRDAYFAAANVWARAVAEQDIDAALRRRAAQDRERIIRPFRRLAAALSGGGEAE
jgi:hypothetical protein